MIVYSDTSERNRSLNVIILSQFDLLIIVDDSANKTPANEFNLGD